MRWRLAHKGHRTALALADRHYSRQKPGTRQMMPPGRTLVLVVPGRAVWGSLLQEKVDHAWPGAWVCSIFRNEGAGLSSELIAEAVAATRWAWGDNPHGMVTFVDLSEVRRKRDPGRCFRRAGFRVVGRTAKRGHLVLHLALDEMPDAEPPLDGQLPLFGEVAA